jgi:hypothetical protein
MVPGGQFRYDTAIFHMDIDLAEQGMGQQPALCVIERDPGLVAGGLKAQN